MNTFIEIDDDYLVIIGVFPNERTTPQAIHINFRYEVKLPPDDTIESACDYTEIKNHIRQFVSQNQFHLIETLASQLINSLFSTYPLISATLRLTKKAYNVTVEVSL